MYEAHVAHSVLFARNGVSHACIIDDIKDIIHQKFLSWRDVWQQAVLLASEWFQWMR